MLSQKSQDTIHPEYRPDIDGLRGIAVLSVVLFHAFPRSLQGGFVGVDIFFVISGFLISTIIFRNLDRNTFSLRDFYFRRIRRIFPALGIVLLSVLVFGWFCLFPGEMKQLGSHVAASSGFIQNLILWKESGYFDNLADTKPLLHIWSLGIEEQFYFVYPLFLLSVAALSKVFGRSYKKSIYLLALSLVFILSFLLNLDLIKIDPTKAFYLPQYRLFELTLGGILSWVVLYQADIPISFAGSQRHFFPRWLTRKLARNFLSFLGLIALLFTFGQFSRETVFPGKNALLPIFATALIIFAGPKSWLNEKILSHKILVKIGLISFPLYLWHWPILSYGRIIYGETTAREFRLIAVAISILLAWLTVKFVEKPFRFGNEKVRLKVVTLCLMVFCIGGAGLYSSRHQPEPALSESRKETNMIVARAIDNCKKKFPKWDDPQGIGTDQPCSLQTETPTIALIGDSHSGHLYYGLVHKLKHTHESVVNFPASCAAPLMNVSTGMTPSQPFRSNNARLMNWGYEYIGKTDSIRTVYLAHNPICSSNNAVDLGDTTQENYLVVLRNGLVRSLQFLISKNKNVVIVLDIPIFPYYPAKCKSRGTFFDFLRTPCDISIISESRNRYNQIVGEVVTSQFPNVKILNLAELFCNSGKCNPVQGGKLLYPDHDSGHLNDDGSVFVSDFLLKAIP